MGFEGNRMAVAVLIKINIPITITAFNSFSEKIK